jgi:hypothetical protein
LNNEKSLLEIILGLNRTGLLILVNPNLSYPNQPKTKNAKRKTQNAKRKTQNAKRKMQNAKRKMQNAKRKMQNAKRKTKIIIKNKKIPWNW